MKGGQEISHQRFRPPRQMTFQQLAGLLRACGPAQIAVQNPATWSGKTAGECPQQGWLVEMVQHAVADDQIGTSDQLRQNASLQILQRGMSPAHRQTVGGRALSRNRQHGSSTVHPHNLSVGMRRRQRQCDVARPATKIDEQRRWRQCRGTRQQGLNQRKRAAISIAEIRLRIGLNLLRIIHEFRLRDTLHGKEAENTSLSRTLPMVENRPC